MPRLSHCFLALLIGGSLLAVGCQKLNQEKDFEMDAGEWKFYTIDGFQSDKQITVKATSETAPIVVVVVDGGEPDSKTLAKMDFGKDARATNKEASKDVELTANVAAKKTFTVCVTAFKKTKVHLKITSN